MHLPSTTLLSSSRTGTADRQQRAAARTIGLTVLPVLVAVVLAQLIGSGVGGATGTDVGGAEAALQEARDARVAAEHRLDEVYAEKAALEQEIQRLDSGAAQITEDLAAAHQQVREFAVAAYIDGGQGALMGASLSVDESAALAWRAQVLGSQTVEAADAVSRFNALKESNDPDRLAAAARLDAVNSLAEQAHGDALQAAAHERDAEWALQESTTQRDEFLRKVSDSEAASASTRSSNASSTSSGDRPADSVSEPGVRAATASEAAMLARVRHCESRGNYGIVSGSGRYRGAYQFDTRTWASVGGSGDPAAASPAEQDYRALLLLRERGRRPWPNCA